MRCFSTGTAQRRYTIPLSVDRAYRNANTCNYTIPLSVDRAYRNANTCNSRPRRRTTRSPRQIPATTGMNIA
eukprot:1207143-Rhodomonas_salina.2